MMCEDVYFRETEACARTVGELTAMLGPDAKIWLEGGGGHIEPGYCLCPVEIDRTLSEAGFQYDHHDTGYDAWSANAP